MVESGDGRSELKARPESFVREVGAGLIQCVAFWPGILCMRCLGLLHCLGQGTLLPRLQCKGYLPTQCSGTVVSMLASGSHFCVSTTAAFPFVLRERTSSALELNRGALQSASAMHLPTY